MRQSTSSSSPSSSSETSHHRLRSSSSSCAGSLAFSSSARSLARTYTHIVVIKLDLESKSSGSMERASTFFMLPTPKQIKEDAYIFQSLGSRDLITSTEGSAKQSAPNDSYLDGIQTQWRATLLTVQNVCNFFSSCERSRNPVEARDWPLIGRKINNDNF